MIKDLVARQLRCVPIDEVMAHLARLTELDRYQASLGIERAAELIAGAADAIGLAHVTIERFAADGATAWWTFAAPRAWTPTTARLAIPGAGIELDHATQPFTIATYSAPTPLGGLVARVVRVRGDAGELDLTGAVAVIDAADFARPDLLAILAARGAVGFITDATCRGPAGEYVGRIELSPHTTLSGFSVTRRQRVAIERAAGAGAEVHLSIEVDRSARMPVVTAVLPGRGADEVWLTSHLCHPRAGANDNASGSAALLGVAAALVDRRTELARDFERSIRFVWGPEFLGVAALLHDRFRPPAGRPRAVINLDMVGEDPAQCGVPLVVERAPEWCASIVTPLAEHIVEEAFAQTHSHVGAWQPGPFLGFSDHGLFANFADHASRSPAVQLWHPGDPFNHSAADTLDKVSPMQLKRATVSGAVLAEVLASEGGVDLERIVARWCDREDAATARVAQRHHELQDGAWSRRLVEHVRAQNAVMLALVVDGPAAMRAPARENARAFVARWPGPFNYRGLLADLSTGLRDEVVSLFTTDKRNYALLTYLALLAEGSHDLDGLVDAASFALRAPVNAEAARVLWSALRESAWIEEA